MLGLDVLKIACFAALICMTIFRSEFEDAWTLWWGNVLDDKDSNMAAEDTNDDEAISVSDETTETSQTEVYNEEEHIVHAPIIEPVEVQDPTVVEAQASEPIVATTPEHDAEYDEPLFIEATPAGACLEEIPPQKDEKDFAPDENLAIVAQIAQDGPQDNIAAPIEAIVLPPTQIEETTQAPIPPYMPAQAELAAQAITSLHGMTNELQYAMQGFAGHIIASSHGYAEHGDKIFQLLIFASQSLAGPFPNDMNAQQASEFSWTQLVSSFWDEVQPRGHMFINHDDQNARVLMELVYKFGLCLSLPLQHPDMRPPPPADMTILIGSAITPEAVAPPEPTDQLPDAPATPQNTQPMFGTGFNGTQPFTFGSYAPPAISTPQKT